MSPRTRRLGVTLAGLATASLALSGCGAAGQGGDSDAINVVASTNVWGSVAQAIGGDAVQVESIINDGGTDPHSYESTPADAAKVNDADLVVHNGGGYDEFVDKILNSGQGNEHGRHAVRAVDAANEHEPTTDQHPPEGAHEHGNSDEHGQQPGHSEGTHAGHGHSTNEHVWYDVHAVRAVADQVAAQLEQVQPQRAQEFRDNTARFEQGLDGLQQRVESIAQADRGKPVIVTEPVAHYLVREAGLRDVTPKEFVNAVEAEQDPPATAIAQIQQVLASGTPAAVIYNPQTESPLTKQVKQQAEQRGIPVVETTETMPMGENYLNWMGGQIDRLGKALEKK